MGTGKSTVGRLLADTLGYTLIDLDAEIERVEGRTISEMFEADGEPYFREAESVALRSDFRERKGIVVASGGGAVLRSENCDVMKRGGWVVALTADASSIVERVRGDANRPLLAGMSKIEFRVSWMNERTNTSLRMS